MVLRHVIPIILAVSLATILSCSNDKSINPEHHMATVSGTVMAMLCSGMNPVQPQENAV